MLFHEKDPLTKHLVKKYDIFTQLHAGINNSELPITLTTAYVRVLLRLTAVTDVRESMLNVPTLRLVDAVLQRGLPKIETEESRTEVLEAMRLLVAITLPLGPLNLTPQLPTDEEFEVFKSLVHIFQQFLFLPREGPLYDQLRAQTVTCLINVPARCTELFDPERTLEALLYVLGVQVQVAEATKEPTSALLSVLLVLTSIARAIPRARTIIKQTIFPPEIASEAGTTTADGVNMPVEVKASGCLASKIIPHMCSLDTSLKTYASQFMYEVCDEDPNELIRLTGFGYSAGLLAMYGLFQPGQVQQVSSRTIDPDEHPEEFPEEPPQELIDLMQRLEERGLLRVITKDEIDDDAPPDPHP